MLRVSIALAVVVAACSFRGTDDLQRGAGGMGAGGAPEGGAIAGGGDAAAGGDGGDGGDGGCGGGTVACAGYDGCFDLAMDAAHCGACAWDCEAGSCIGGLCTPVIIARTPNPPYGPYALSVGQSNVFVTSYLESGVYSVDKTAARRTTASIVTAIPMELWALAVDDAAMKLYVAATSGAYEVDLPADVTPTLMPTISGAAWFVTRAAGATFFLTDEGIFQYSSSGTIQRLARSGILLGTMSVNNAGVIVYSELLSVTGNVWDFDCPQDDSIVRTLDVFTEVPLATMQPCAYFVRADATHAYFTTSDGGHVRKVPLIGGAVVDLSSGHTQPSGLVVDATHVYWVSSGIGAAGGELRRVALDGSGEQLLASGLPRPVTIEQDAPDGRRLFISNTDPVERSVMRIIKPAP